MTCSRDLFKKHIRDVPDFPQKGIVFKDITTLLLKPEVLDKLVDEMLKPFALKKIDGIAGIEARGFILGSIIAYKLKLPFIPIRKKGKLPAETVSQEYQLEYGTDIIEIHKDGIADDGHYLIVDDLLATGGTMEAAVSLIKKMNGIVVGCAFGIELQFLNGRNKLPEIEISAPIKY